MATRVSNREFEEWASPHLPAMLRLATSLSSVSDAADAADIVQDALLRAWWKWDQYDPERGPPKPWLLALVYNAARLASRRRRPQLTLRTETDLPTVSSSSNLDLRKAVNCLSKRQREAVILYYYVDLPVQQVAELMKIAPGTVQSTLSDARESLRQFLGVEYGRD